MVNESLNGANSGSHYGSFGNISSYWWLDSNLSDEFPELEGAVHLSCFPNYFELDHRVKTSVQPDDIYGTLLDHPPRKLVSVGPEYQADVPEWAPQGSKNSVDACSYLIGDDYRENMVGTCVIPMPDLESPAFDCCLGDGTDSDCNCTDYGSIGCLRLHVLEARDKLREKFGQKIYEELGFCDMGEEVAKKWSEEEEQAFHEVVFSNPASLGKNFWDHLPYVFPSRAKKDLVSYYFNVFMLRLRAEQNRCDPLNIDSDNDEWQGCEVGVMEEDEDSVVESLANQDGPLYNEENYEEDFFEASDNEDDTSTDNNNCTNLRYVKGEQDGKISDGNTEDQEIQDNSCTSYEDQSDPVTSGTDARESSQE